MRHLCDAIEIAAGFGGLPPGLDVAAAIKKLAAVQEPETGLLPDPLRPPRSGAPLREDGLALYNILAIGYASLVGWLPAPLLLLVSFVAIFWLFSFVFALVSTLRDKAKVK